MTSPYPRLTLRPGTVDDIEATWRFRRLDEVSRWITRAPDTLEEYRDRFEEPEWLAKTLVVERDGRVSGDLMLSVEEAWAQAEVADRAKEVQAELWLNLAPGPQREGLRHRSGPRAYSDPSAGAARCWTS